MFSFKKYYEFLLEGGYDSPLTQNTVITPEVVKTVLPKVSIFIDQFNQFAKENNIPTIKMGAPLGSTAHHQEDEGNKTYGDLDLQVNVPAEDNKTSSSLQTSWWKHIDNFIKAKQPQGIVANKPGHPLFQIGETDYVQVDLIIHPEPLAEWGRWRTTPQRGLKGLLYGNMFSVLGELLNMSIQHAGVQYKFKDNNRLPFGPTRGNYELKTITTNIKTFILDIFKHEAIVNQKEEAKPSNELTSNPGVLADKANEVTIDHLVKGLHGLVTSFEQNDMFGKGTLQAYSNKEAFLDKFFALYKEKVDINLGSSKRDKASEEKANNDRQTIMSGFNLVKDKLEDIVGHKLPGYSV
jgi:hypothetical protein